MGVNDKSMIKKPEIIDFSLVPSRDDQMYKLLFESLKISNKFLAFKQTLLVLGLRPENSGQIIIF